MNRHHNGVGVRMCFAFPPSSYHIFKYLPVTLPIFSGDEKSNLIHVPDGFGHPRLIPIPEVDNFFFLLKIKVFFIPERKVVMTNALFSKKMMTIDDYGDEEERGRECGILKEKRKNYDNCVI